MRSWSWPATAYPRPLGRVRRSTRRVPLVSRPEPGGPDQGRAGPCRRGQGPRLPGRRGRRGAGGRRPSREHGPTAHPATAPWVRPSPPCSAASRKAAASPARPTSSDPGNAASHASRSYATASAASRDDQDPAPPLPRLRQGDWCPGLADHPAHPSADLVADHVVEVAAGGPEAGPLRVLCRSENSRRSARVLSSVLALDPSPAERPITHDDGPVVA
jgi:hypothetical protein